LSKYYHTLRYLKPIQIYGRLWFKVHNPVPNLAPPPPIRSVTGVWNQPAQKRSSLIFPHRFRFLNKECDVDSPSAWNDPDIEKLWLYNLHYFDDLNSKDAENRCSWHEALIHRWIEENPPAKGNGWEPYPLSLRIVNWIKWILSGNNPREWLVSSLAIQVRYLERKIEWHLLGNHLFANAKALIFAGLFFSGPEAQKWLTKGLKILEREIPEQVLEDGGHFELSPMYHSIILEDILDLYNLSRAYPEAFPPQLSNCSALWEECANKMRSWLSIMCHPDGAISFFNDAAMGIAASPGEMEAYACRLDLPPIPTPKEGITHLAHSGYVRLQKNEAVAILDIGKIGPDYIPGHAHADNLTFELSLFGSRVIVNSGTSCYGDSEERIRQRSTSSHNTVVVDGMNSSEVWGGFRVARRAYPLEIKIDDLGDEGFQVVAAHDGYVRLPDQTIHRRTWKLLNQTLEINDYVGSHLAKIVSRFHFHPDVFLIDPEDLNSEKEKIRLGIIKNRLNWYFKSGSIGKLENSTYHPEFGLSSDNFCLNSEINAASASNILSWF
jgi:uncharacterized heparinase superfamily protein